MEKYCFVHLDNINRMPYIQKYIDSAQYDYDLVYWNRNKTDEKIGADKYYPMVCPDGKSKISKIIIKAYAYMRFGMFASRILKKNNYKGVFVFTPNVGMLCYRVLKKKYNKKYILDIRDYWMENQKWLQYIEKRLVKHSYANVISSKAYLNFLPKAKYTLTHNSQNMSNEIVNAFRERKIKKSKIVLSCIGGAKYIEYDKSVIKYFADPPPTFLVTNIITATPQSRIRVIHML